MIILYKRVEENAQLLYLGNVDRLINHLFIFAYEKVQETRSILP